RERSAGDAAAVVAGLAPLMAGADIAYKKIDSLLRGPTIAELAACMRTGLWGHAVLCPAFPYQGRSMRGGRQYARDASGEWSAVTGDLVAALNAAGTVAYHARPGCPLLSGIGVFDAETDDDLGRVAASGLAAGDVLWIGAGGLAQALSGNTGAENTAPLPGPILGLFGTDHAVTASQLACCDPHWVRLRGADPMPIVRRLRDPGLVLASFDLPENLSRADAAERIRGGFASLLRELPPPGTLLAAGGETLFAICEALGATQLEVNGRIVPGLPRSILRGGRWDGMTVISKSGAFGTPALLRDLVVKRTIP
ncbi:MAG TPA: nucleotide-binding domain containing protein, partial [Rhodopila sp.]